MTDPSSDIIPPRITLTDYFLNVFISVFVIRIVFAILNTFYYHQQSDLFDFDALMLPLVSGVVAGLAIVKIRSLLEVRCRFVKSNHIICRKARQIFYYLGYMLPLTGFVLTAAFIQNLYIVGIPPEKLKLKVLLIPLLVAVIAGYFLGKINSLKKEIELQFSRLVTKDHDLEKLNESLEGRIDERTRELSDNRKLTQEILDTQANIVILTDGTLIKNANSSFFRFLGEFRDLEHFKQTHNCICDFFVTIPGKEYIGKEVDGENWVKYIYQNEGRNFQAMIRRGSSETVFDIKVSRLVSSMDEELYVATLTDISILVHYRDELEDNRNRLQKQLVTDTLTGMPNRRQLLEDISKNEERTVLILVNIDSFKEINDFFGHLTGDLILREVGKKIIESLEDPGNNVYRVGADEYSVLLTDNPSMQKVSAICDRIYSVITKHSFSGNTGSDISVSITQGIASSDDAVQATESLITLADIALKKAKKSYSHYLYYHEKLDSRNEFGENIKKAVVIKNALNRSDIFPYYQPILNNITGKIDKYECLARMKDQDGHILNPDYFIRVAKATRLYPGITLAILENAGKKIKSSQCEFSVNISIEDILNEQTFSNIFQVVKEYNMADRLVFELLESEGIENFKKVNSFIEKARVHGCKIAIDDFGSGYSSFEYILKMKVDYIKIDGSLIRNIDVDRNARVIVSTIADFARKMEIKTIAEYVHNSEIQEITKELGIDFAQGYFIGKPLAALLEKQMPV